jgi:hypothetical protein
VQVRLRIQRRISLQFLNAGAENLEKIDSLEVKISARVVPNANQAVVGDSNFCLLLQQFLDDIILSGGSLLGFFLIKHLSEIQECHLSFFLHEHQIILQRDAIFVIVFIIHHAFVSAVHIRVDLALHLHHVNELYACNE